MIAGVVKSLLFFQHAARRALRLPGAVIAVFAIPILLLWVAAQLFGELPSTMRAFPTRTYLEFATPAIAVVGVLPAAVYLGTCIFADLDSGFIEQLLASTASQSSILIGRLLALAAWAIVSTLLVLIAAMLGGFDAGSVTQILALTPLSALLAIIYGALSLALALVLRRRALSRVITSALLIGSFAISDTILPASILPGWLNALSNSNPATYAARGARLIMSDNIQYGSYDRDMVTLAIAATASILLAFVAFRQCVDSLW